MINSPAHECAAREDLEQLQVERLQATLNRVNQNVAFYKESFAKSGVDIGKVKGLADLSELPFTTKDDLRQVYPYGFFAVPLKDIVRVHSTSGTTGKPIVVGYTNNDLNVWNALIARVLNACAITEHDLVQIAFNYNLSSAALGFQYGAEKIGASVIPSSSENVERQILVLKDYKTTALISTPSYALHIASVLKEEGIHPESLSLRVALLGAQPWSEKLREEIESALHVDAYDNYGLTELIGPGVAFECDKRNGLHINEDHFIPEIIDPDSLKTLPPGETGELVFTTITKQGFPLIRYRTGDISSLIPEPCACGRSLIRMSRVSGRTDDIIIVDGVNVFPSQIEEKILEVKGFEPHYRIVLDRVNGKETFAVQVEVSEKFPFFDEMGKIETLCARLKHLLVSSLGIDVTIIPVEPKSLQRSRGEKLKTIIDKREP